MASRIQALRLKGDRRHFEFRLRTPAFERRFVLAGRTRDSSLEY